MWKIYLMLELISYQRCQQKCKKKCLKQCSHCSECIKDNMVECSGLEAFSSQGKKPALLVISHCFSKSKIGFFCILTISGPSAILLCSQLWLRVGNKRTFSIWYASTLFSDTVAAAGIFNSYRAWQAPCGAPTARPLASVRLALHESSFCFFFLIRPMNPALPPPAKASPINPSADTLQEMSPVVENVVSTCSMSAFVSVALHTVAPSDYSRKLLG